MPENSGSTKRRNKIFWPAGNHVAPATAIRKYTHFNVQGTGHLSGHLLSISKHVIVLKERPFSGSVFYLINKVLKSR